MQKTILTDPGGNTLIAFTSHRAALGFQEFKHKMKTSIKVT